MSLCCCAHEYLHTFWSTYTQFKRQATLPLALFSRHICRGGLLPVQSRLWQAHSPAALPAST
eukprot:scaffold105030_cov23-Tisochrysis_lutea.AAC.1